MLSSLYFMKCTLVLSVLGICYFCIILLSKLLYPIFPWDNTMLPWVYGILLLLASMFRCLANVIIYFGPDGNLEIQISDWQIYLMIKAVVITTTTIITVVLFLFVSNECQKTTQENKIKPNCQWSLATLEGICIFFIAIDVYSCIYVIIVLIRGNQPKSKQIQVMV